NSRLAGHFLAPDFETRYQRAPLTAIASHHLREGERGSRALTERATSPPRRRDDAKEGIKNTGRYSRGRKTRPSFSGCPSPRVIVSPPANSTAPAASSPSPVGPRSDAPPPRAR